MNMSQFDSSGSMYPNSPLPFPVEGYSNFPPPGFETTLAAVTPSPPISSLQGIWDEIKQDAASAVSAVETGVKTVYGGVKDITKTVYGDISSGVGTVADDVTKPVKQTYWYMILGVGVLFVGFYYLGKSGVLKVSV